MQRRDVLRRGGILAATLLTTGLAGCSGSDDSDGNGEGDDGDGDEGNGNDGSDPGATETPSGPVGEVAESGVSGLEIVDWTAAEGDGEIQVTLTVENVGDQTTDAFEYDYGGIAYDSSGEDITAGVATGSTNATTVNPSETATLNMYIGVLGDASTVARFELTLTCGAFSEGVYCE